jgi:hypothetical protein
VIENIRYVGDLAGAIGWALLKVPVLMAGLGLWVAIVLGAKKCFRRWRIYSHHPLAKRIRVFLRARRAARESKAAANSR